MNVMKNKQTHRKSKNGRRRGQSLVEFALVLPLLLLIVAGALETGNVLTFYNRAQLAAREGARFGAAGGSDLGVKEVVEQSSIDTLEVDPDFLSIWVIRPTIEWNSSSGTWQWDNSENLPPWGLAEECVYGDQCGDIDNPPQPAPVDAQDVLDEISQISGADAQSLNGTTFVVVAVYYEVDTVLNLSFFQIPEEANGRVPVRTHAIMNQEIIQASSVDIGCSSYAAVIEKTWVDGLSEGDLIGPLKFNQLDEPGRRAGYGFLAWRLGQTTGNWLMSQGVNGASMGFPGTSRLDGLGFIEYDSFYGDPDPDVYDTGLHRGDWVLASEASDTSVASTPLNDHVDTQRDIRVIIYTYEHDSINNIPLNPRYVSFNGGPEWWQYRIDAFAIVRLHSWEPGGGSCNSVDMTCDTVTFEFIRWDESCGYDF